MPVVEIFIRDEISRSLDQIKKSFAKSAEAIPAELTYQVSRDFGTTLKLLGLSSAFVSGGFIASIVAMSRSLTQFAAKRVAIEDTAHSLNLTLHEFKALVDLGVRQGLTKEESRADIERMAEAAMNLREGADSETRHILEGRGAAGSGTIVARELQAQLKRDGDKPFQTMLRVLRQMDLGADGSDAQRLASEVWREAFGLNSSAWNRAFRDYQEFTSEEIEASEEAAASFLVDQVVLEHELDDLQNEVGNVLMPAFIALSDLLLEYMSPEGIKAFADRVESWVRAIADQDWDAIRRSVMEGLDGVVADGSKFVRDAATIVDRITHIAETVARWQGWDGGPVKYLLPEIKIIEDELEIMSPQKFSGGVGSGWHAPGQIQRFAGSRSRQVEQTKELALEMHRLADVMRDQREGAGGGNTEGGVTKKGRSAPFETAAGGAGGPPLPGDSSGAAELRRQAAGSGSAITQLGAQSIGDRVYPISQVISNTRLQKQMGIDENISFMNKTRAGAYYGFATPGGVAYTPAVEETSGTLTHEAGHRGRALAEEEGRRDPNIFKRYGFNAALTGDARAEEARQRMLDSDIANNLRNSGTISMDASLARMQDASAGLEKTFGGRPYPNLMREWSRHEAMADAQARKMLDRDASGRMTGRLNLDVNVRGGRGTTVGNPETEGNFIPADGIEINRQMSSP